MAQIVFEFRENKLVEVSGNVSRQGETQKLDIRDKSQNMHNMYHMLMNGRIERRSGPRHKLVLPIWHGETQIFFKARDATFYFFFKIEDTSRRPRRIFLIGTFRSNSTSICEISQLRLRCSSFGEPGIGQPLNVCLFAPPNFVFDRIPAQSTQP